MAAKKIEDVLTKEELTWALPELEEMFLHPDGWLCACGETVEPHEKKVCSACGALRDER